MKNEKPEGLKRVSADYYVTSAWMSVKRSWQAEIEFSSMDNLPVRLAHTISLLVPVYPLFSSPTHPWDSQLYESPTVTKIKKQFELKKMVKMIWKREIEWISTRGSKRKKKEERSWSRCPLGLLFPWQDRKKGGRRRASLLLLGRCPL